MKEPLIRSKRLHTIAFALVLISSLLLSACASAEQLKSNTAAKMAIKSSCDNPVIIKHKDDSTLDAAGKRARISLMGFTQAVPVTNGVCANPSVETYAIVGSIDKEPNIEEPETRLYVRHMTKAQIKADPNIKCKPTYSQVYQPPLKLGGSGRVIQIPNGEKCEGVG